MLAGSCIAAAAAQPPTPAGGEQPPAVEPTAAPSVTQYESRPIREVAFKGIRPEDETLVRNQVRSGAGQPLRKDVVEADLQRLVRLGRFRELTASVEPFDDGTVRLVFEAVQAPVVRGVDVVGNRQISNEELRGEVNLLAGTPVDRFQIDRTLRRIKDLYQKKGFYQADVTIDERELAESGIVLFRIREGERLRITDIRFSGNDAIPSRRLRPEIKSETVDIFKSGTLDDNTLDQDVATLVQYYKDRGYLDVRVDREVRQAPNAREAIITFLIDEGPLYHLRSVRVELDNGGLPSGKPPEVMSPEQIAGLIAIKPGDAYSLDKLRRSIQAISDAYAKMGYADARVGRVEARDPDHPEVDLVVLVSEGRQYRTGTVTIRGNDLTQQKVVRRAVMVYPDHPLDGPALKETELRLRESNIFDRNAVKVTVQPEDPENPGYRDVLVQVGETNTGSLSFGAAVSSDGGLLGSISLRQRNFDIADTPESFDELIQGRAFRGGGQDFNISIQPGTTYQIYSISLGDPRIFDTELSGTGAFAYRTSRYREWDEERLGGNFSIGRRFGDVWTGGLTLRAERINLTDISPTTAADIVASGGENMLTGLGVRFRRATVDSTIRPTKGSKFEAGLERIGAFGGDLQFTKFNAEYVVYIPVYEDFLGRKTILQLRSSVNYIPENKDEVPVYERFYLGGREMRGFQFRTVSPRGPRADNPALISEDPIGGTWSFYAGAQIEHPVWQQFLSVVGFIDTGTVTFNPGFDEYRVAVGVGVRIYFPALGPAPLAFDFGFPLAKQPFDRERLFSFSIDVPF